MSKALLGITSVLAVATGCTTVERLLDKYADRQPPQGQQPPAQENRHGADEMDFGALRWTYGGFNGAHATPDLPTIGGLRFGHSDLFLDWRIGLSVWGLAYDEAGALACLFVQLSDGRWVGGKFDWISTSRNWRDYKNIHGNYNGWTLAGFPNPAPAAFVVVDKSGRRRSNVIVGSWKR